MATILLTGATGFLGHYVLAELRKRGSTVVVAGRRDADVELDLDDLASIQRAVDAAQAERVLHVAAISTVGACEREPERAHRVNAAASGRLARAFAGRCVLVSTDLVFDGRAAPYTVDAVPAPVSVYGRTKRDAELEVLAAGGTVVRVPLLFGRSRDGRRGATDMLRAATEQPVTLFNNEYRTPLHAADAARGLVDAVTELRSGVLHLPGPERVSRWELARRFVEVTGARELRLEEGECTDASRPRDVALAGEWSCGRSLSSALGES